MHKTEQKPLIENHKKMRDLEGARHTNYNFYKTASKAFFKAYPINRTFTFWNEGNYFEELICCLC